MKFFVAFCAMLAVAAGGVRDKRGFLSGLHSAPVVSYSAPAVSYAAPAVSYVAPAVSYAAPAVSYAAPTYSYAAPAYSYSAPAVSYAAPAVSYAAPAVSYAAPVIRRYIAPSVSVHRVAPVVHRTVSAPIYASGYSNGWW